MGRKPNKPDPIAHWPLRCTAARYRDQAGTREWYWRARQHTTGAQRKLGWVRDGARTEVEAAVHRLAAAALAAGLFDEASGPSEGQGAPRTVEELLNRYVKARGDDVYRGDVRQRPRVKGQITPETHHKYEVSAGHVIAWIGPVLLSELGEQHFKRYALGRRHSDTTPAKSDRTVFGELEVLRFALIYGADRGWCRRLQTRVVDPDPNAYVNNHRTPQVAEARKAIAELAEPWRLVAEVIAWTGARSAEITGDPVRPGSGVHAGDVDLGRGVLALVGKGNARREVPLHPELLRRLAEVVALREPGELLFQGDPEDLPRRARAWPGLYKQDLRDRMLAACERAGVPAFTPQGLRRLVDDQLYDANSDPGTSGAILGHSPEVALRNYRRARLSRRREVLQRAGLGQLVQRKPDNVVELPTARLPVSDLSNVRLEDLLEELRRRTEEDLEEPGDEELG